MQALSADSAVAAGSASAPSRGRSVLVLASYAPSLTRFRGTLLADMVRAGHRVTAAAPEDDAQVRRDLAAMGVRYLTVPMARTGLNPFADLGTVFALYSLLRAEKPDVFLAYTMKPMIYGGIAARFAGIANRYMMNAGLGYVFTDEEGGATLKQKFLRVIASRLYRIGLAGAKAVFAFNRDDAEEMVARGMLAPGVKPIQVAGSGIDLEQFAHRPVPAGPPVFLMICRLLKHKGLLEYVEAARQLKKRHPQAQVQLLGPLDPNPSGITQADLDQWVREGAIAYLGETRDVRPFLAACSVYVLPSFYREGIPRTILEAMATGRAIITTDSPGCRETVTPGDNGFLVPVRDAGALAEAMARFSDDPALAERMGLAARRVAETRFDVKLVNAQLLRTMGLL